VGHDISSRLIAARRRRGWSREALAYHSGLSWSAIAQIESGRRTGPRPDTLVSLARALGVTVAYLVGDDSARTTLAHRALLYGSDDAFVEAIVPFVSEGMDRAEPVLVVTSGRNVDLVRREVPDGNVTFAESSEWYGSPLTAVTACRSFAKERIEAGAPWIRIVGEPVWPSGSDDDVGPWATYESMFNLIFGTAPLTVVCPYDSRSLDPSIIGVARRTHPYLAEGMRLERNDAYVDPEEFVLGR
jgi:transcriptional regulator with XRE-family HTH domain